MDMTELKTGIKILLGKELSPEDLNALKQIIVRQETVALAESKTADGKVLSYEGELVQGTAVNLVTEAGSEPAPDGEYMLEDGATKVVIAAGVVTSVEKAGEMPEVPAVMPEMVQQMETKFASQVKSIEDSYSAKFAAQKSELEKLQGEIKLMATTFAKLIETPIEVVKMSETKQKTWEEMTPKERYDLAHPIE